MKKTLEVFSCGLSQSYIVTCPNGNANSGLVFQDIALQRSLLRSRFLGSSRNAPTHKRCVTKLKKAAKETNYNDTILKIPSSRN